MLNSLKMTSIYDNSSEAIINLKFFDLNSPTIAKMFNYEFHYCFDNQSYTLHLLYEFGSSNGIHIPF